MFYKNDDIENGMLLGKDEESTLSQYDIDYENQDDERDNKWFEENMRGME